MRLADLGDALRFLTRLPVPAAGAESRAIGFGAAAFPLVGLMLGAIAIGVDVTCAPLPQAARDVAILVAWALLTGALHHDGLADVLDAMGGSSCEDRLRIMRDASLGTFATLGLVLVVAADLAALGGMEGASRHRSLLVAPILGRTAMLLLAFQAPRAREDGLGAEFCRRLDASEVITATVAAVVLTLGLGGFRGVAAIAVTSALAAALRRYSRRAFGGVTGDVLGAGGKLTETAVLLLWSIR